MTLIRSSNWPAAAALAAALLLATAHAFQTFGGYAPCELCLRQRDVYWAILVVAGLLALVAPRRLSLVRPACLLLGLLFLLEAGIAIYHAGVEWRIFQGPASCTSAGAHAISVKAMTLLMTAPPKAIVQCDVAAFRIFGLSMAGWNALAAVSLVALSLYFARRSEAP